MQAALAAPQRISTLTLISPTARFLQAGDWPAGISASVFDQLLRITRKKYEVGLKRFLQMQLPHEDQLDLRNQMFESINKNRPSDFALQAGYETLSNTDLRCRLSEITTPTQVIAAKSDNVISPITSQRCADQIPNASFQMLGDCHFLPMTQPIKLAELLSKFELLTAFEKLTRPTYGDTIDRQQVARQFSKAAESYDSAAQLQRELGQSLIDQMEPDASGTLIDMGCGTGEALQQIKNGWPDLTINRR